MKQGHVAGSAAGPLGDHRDHHLRAPARPRDHHSRLRASGNSDQDDSVAVRGTIGDDGTPLVRDPDDGGAREQGSLADSAKDRRRRSPAEERAIRQALVPTQEVVEIKNGKKVTVERKLYPGYVLVEMDMNQETAHVVNGIQGVIKFVGHDSRFPQPLRADEVNRLLGIADEAEEEAPQGRDSVPGGSGSRDHRRTVHRFQWNGRRSDGGQGKGPSVGVAVWAADVGRIGLLAVEGVLSAPASTLGVDLMSRALRAPDHGASKVRV